MKYALVKNSNIVVVGPREYSKGVFEHYLRKNGVQNSLPVAYADAAVIEIDTEYKILPVNERGVSVTNRKIQQIAGPTQTIYNEYVDSRYYVTNKSVGVVQQELKSLITAERNRREQAGVVYTFPDGEGTVQTRDETDLRNIHVLSTTAMVMKSAGVVDPVLQFRDRENVIHNMTPDQTIEFGLFVQSYINNIYQWSWQKKDEIDACTDVAQLDLVDLEIDENVLRRNR